MVKNKSENFAKYMRSVLQNSMLTGIPQIASAGSSQKRIIRTLVFIGCIVGFIYQTLTFLWMYWEYKTIIDVRVYNPREVLKPAVTVCNSYGLMLSKLCNDPKRELYGIQCKALINSEDHNWCDCRPRYCFQGRLREDVYDVPWNNITNFRNVNPEVRENWLATLDEFIEYCGEYKMKRTSSSYEGEYCKEADIFQIQCPHTFETPDICVTINSLVGKPDDATEKVLPDARLILALHNLEDQTPTELKRVETYAIVHSPYTLENPFKDGFLMERKVDYQVNLKQVVKHLLPYPYETDCFDYRSQWKARGGSGPTTMKGCVQECRKNLSLARHGCVLRDLSLPGNERLCSLDLKDNTLYEDSEECSSKCKPACLEEYYVQDRDYVFQDDEKKCGKRATLKPYSGLQINFQGMETTVYTYSPKFENIETFSYVGGYVGMWLGISLVAVFDFLETVVIMLKYPWKKMLYRKEKRARLEALQKARRNLV